MQLLGILLVGFFFLRVWMSAFAGIHPDEAYYWTWSLNLSWSYFDHPPMIAWLIRASGDFFRWLVSPERWQQDPLFWAQISLRFVPFFFSAVLTPFVIAKCIEVVQKRPLRLLQTFFLVTSPLVVLGPQIVTPDTPLFLFWSLVLLGNMYFLRSRKGNVFTDRPTPFSWTISIGVGLALALASYSKYTALLAGFLLVISGVGLYNSIVAGLVSVLLSMPQLIWNIDTGVTQGAGIWFQLDHAFGLKTLPVANWRRVGDLVISQFILWSPLVFFNAIFLPLVDLRRFFQRPQESRLTGSLAIWALTPLILFSLVALHKPAEANWPLVGLIPAMVLTASRLRHRAEVLLLGILVHISLIVGFFFVFTQGPVVADWIDPWRPKIAERLRSPSRLKEFQHWEHLHSFVRDTTTFDQDPIFIESYQALSVLLFFEHHQRTDLKIGRPLWIDSGLSRMSEFQLNPMYSPPTDQVIASYWLILRPNLELPQNCRLIRHFFKVGEVTPWTAARCVGQTSTSPPPELKN